MSMQSLAAKVSALAILAISGTANAAIIDETGGGAAAGQGAAGGAPVIGAAENQAMRTTVSLNAIQKAFDESDPRENVAVYKYDRGTTYKLRLREFMSATIILPEGEAIDAYNLGDTKNFEFIPYSSSKDKKDDDKLENVFSVRPIYPGADTSLTIVGRSRRVYNFYLRADSVKSAYMPIFTAYIEDPAPGLIPAAKSAPDATTEKSTAPVEAPKPVTMTGEDAAAEAEYLRSLPLVDPTNIRLDRYKIAGGDGALAPVKIFDDGYWTYFKLTDDKTLDKVKVPTIYRVVDGYDTPVNQRVEGGTLIAETTSDKWTLRSGEAHLCVRAK